MKHQYHYARKKRNLAVLSNKLQYLITYHKDKAILQIELLIIKIRKLIVELAVVFSKPAISKILGATAFIFGISFANQSTAQSFANPVLNPFGLTNVKDFAAPAFVDLDGDGDIDLLAGEYYGAMKYFENIGTTSNPIFSSPQTNPFGLDSAYELNFPAFADLDADGDMDLLVGEGDGIMQYFQNTGSATNPQFATPQANPFGLATAYYFAMPSFVDLDGDGDFDLLIGEYYGNMKYYQNTGTASNPQFAAATLNPFGLSATYVLACPSFADLDNDGDMDLLVGEAYGALHYFQNTGTASAPQFANPVLNPFGLDTTYMYAFPSFADLDDDGDLDLLVGEYYGNMQYFENTQTSPGFTNTVQEFEFNIYPNPVIDILYIDSKEKYNKIEIINSIGESFIIINNYKNQISLTHLSSGIYTIRLSSEDGHIAARKFMKQ